MRTRDSRLRHSQPLLLLLCLAACSQQDAHRERAAEVSAGRLDKYADFPSKWIPARDVQVWLPPGYSTDRKYRVLYMHDGQMLFDARVTWNRQEWGVDEVAASLMSEGKVDDFIVVGVFNGGDSRHADFLPEKPYHLLDEATRKRYYGVEGSELKADEYVAFLADELKPFIDSHYSVHTDAANTAVAGSSMGGLISMYALAERPDIFGAAACLSTHWPGFDPGAVEDMPDLFIAYMREHLPAPGSHRIYFDYGDQTLDANYPPLQAKVDDLMRELGYDESNWKTAFYPGADHSETAWNARLPSIFMFLFGK